MTKQVNTLLSSRLVSIECQCWSDGQYSRWECLDLVGIPSEVQADALKEKVVAIFEKLGCNIPTESIEACHRISKKNPKVIIKFLQRKDCQQVWDVKRDLQKIKVGGILTCLVRTSYSSIKSYAHITRWYGHKARNYSFGKIYGFFILGDTIKIRVSKNSSPLSLTHVEDNGKYFPDVHLSPPGHSD